MNQRIRELVEQVQNGSDAIHYYDPVFVEKLANLIVNDCVNEIETYRIPMGNSAAGEMACEWTHSALVTIRDSIRRLYDTKDDPS